MRVNYSYFSLSFSLTHVLTDIYSIESGFCACHLTKNIFTNNFLIISHKSHGLSSDLMVPELSAAHNSATNLIIFLRNVFPSVSRNTVLSSLLDPHSLISFIIFSLSYQPLNQLSLDHSDCMFLIIKNLSIKHKCDACVCCCCSVAKSCLTLCGPRDCGLPGSSGPGILQAEILEWVAISFSRGCMCKYTKFYICTLLVYMNLCIFTIQHMIIKQSRNLIKLK